MPGSSADVASHSPTQVIDHDWLPGPGMPMNRANEVRTSGGKVERVVGEKTKKYVNYSTWTDNDKWLGVGYFIKNVVAVAKRVPEHNFINNKYF